MPDRQLIIDRPLTSDQITEVTAKLIRTFGQEMLQLNATYNEGAKIIENVLAVLLMTMNPPGALTSAFDTLSAKIKAGIERDQLKSYLDSYRLSSGRNIHDVHSELHAKRN